MCAVDKAKGLDIGTSHCNDRSARSFIHAIATTVKQEIRERIDHSPFLSIMMDGAADVTGRELVIYLSLNNSLLHVFVIYGKRNNLDCARHGGDINQISYADLVMSLYFSSAPNSYDFMWYARMFTKSSQYAVCNVMLTQQNHSRWLNNFIAIIIIFSWNQTKRLQIFSHLQWL